MEIIENYTEQLNTDNKVQQAFCEYLRKRGIAEDKSESTLESDYYIAKQLFEFNPEIGFEDLETSTIIDFIEWLKAEKRKDKAESLASSTLKTYYNRLSAFFKWLKSTGKIESNPVDNIDTPSVTHDDKQYIDQEGLDKIFRTIERGISWQNNFLRERNIAIFQVLLYTGVRRNELLSIKLRHIDLNRGELLIKKEGSKSKSDRSIPLNSRVKLALQSYLDKRDMPEVDSPYLWISSSTKEKFTVSGLKHLVNKVNKASGVDFSVHQFRHTFAVNSTVQGLNMEELRDLMGHRSLESVRKYLRQVPKEHTREKLEGLNIDAMV
ncbi:MAG: tyrosine-type recombinase/integrase [Candidatus Magasanikbacteria bacterium]